MEEFKRNFGFGFMRLPMQEKEVDIAETCRMVDAFWKRTSPISTPPTAIWRARASWR